MKQGYAKQLLRKTAEGYNKIAEKFSTSRQTIWEELNDLKQYVLAGDRVLDLGCGNGRLSAIFSAQDIDYVGVDFSKNLIKIAKKLHPELRFQQADALALPFPDNYFDKVISIAVLHHIPSKELRLQFFREAKRVLKPNGLLIISVWNLWPRPVFSKLFFKYTFLKLIGKSGLDFKDVLYPWKNNKGKIIFLRHIHAFTKKELERLAKKANLKIERSWIFKKGKRSNIFLIAKK